MSTEIASQSATAVTTVIKSGQKASVPVVTGSVSILRGDCIRGSPAERGPVPTITLGVEEAAEAGRPVSRLVEPEREPPVRGLHLVERPAEDDPAPVDHRHPVGHPLNLVEQVRREE